MASTIDASTSGAGGVITTADNTGILQLKTAGTTAVTVDASQNVGIGTTSPSYKLQVYGASNPEMRLGDAVVTYQLYTEGATAAVMGTVGSHALVYRTNATERMRIDSSGNVLIGMSGVTATGARMDVAQQTDSAVTVASFDARQATSGNQYGIFNRLNGDPNNTVNYFFRCNGGATERATIRSNGGIANFSANNVNLSDEREKKNIELAGNYLDKICAIPVKTFLYNDQTDTDLNLGVIAQDVQAVAPELVSESNWGTEEEPKERLSIYQTDLQYALMKCIQEQQTIINDLKARIETLEAK